MIELKDKVIKIIVMHMLWIKMENTVSEIFFNILEIKSSLDIAEERLVNLKKEQ